MTRYATVYDFESGGLNTDDPIPLEVAAIIVNLDTLEEVPEEKGGQFSSKMRPTDLKRIEKKALEVNQIPMSEIEAAPAEKIVWESFAEFCRKWQTGKSQWNAPVPCTHNGTNFDNKITESLNKKYKINSFFHVRDQYDTYLISSLLLAKANPPPIDKKTGKVSFSMDCLRQYFGISSEGAHRALKDVRDTWTILKRYIKLCNYYAPKVKFQGAMQNEAA